MHIEIRNLTVNDIPAADKIMSLAFATPGNRSEELRRGLTFQPDGWRLALCDGQPIGTVGAIDFGPFAWIGLMTVHPSQQHKGIGGLLMTDILAWLDGRGCPLARLDATHAGAGLYRKFGFFEAGHTFLFYYPKFEPLPDNTYDVTAMQEADIPEAAALDEVAFGASRRRLLRMCLTDFPGTSLIARTKTGELAGYLVAQGDRLGPWISNTELAAEALMRRAFALSNGGGSARVIVPSENAAAVSMFKRLGFDEGLPHVHMARAGAVRQGSAVSDQHIIGTLFPGKRELIYGQASFSMG